MGTRSGGRSRRGVPPGPRGRDGGRRDRDTAQQRRAGSWASPGPVTCARCSARPTRATPTRSGRGRVYSASPDPRLRRLLHAAALRRVDAIVFTAGWGELGGGAGEACARGWRVSRGVIHAQHGARSRRPHLRSPGGRQPGGGAGRSYRRGAGDRAAGPRPAGMIRTRRTPGRRRALPRDRLSFSAAVPLTAHGGTAAGRPRRSGLAGGGERDQAAGIAIGGGRRRA